MKNLFILLCIFFAANTASAQLGGGSTTYTIKTKPYADTLATGIDNNVAIAGVADMSGFTLKADNTACTITVVDAAKGLYKVRVPLTLNGKSIGFTIVKTADNTVKHSKKIVVAKKSSTAAKHIKK